MLSCASLSRRALAAGLVLASSLAFAQSSRATMARKMLEPKDWDELLDFIKANSGKEFELDLAVPAKTEYAHIEKIESKFAGFLLPQHGLVLVVTGGFRMDDGQPIVMRGIYSARSIGTWYGYKRLWLHFVRDV